MRFHADGGICKYSHWYRNPTGFSKYIIATTMMKDGTPQLEYPGKDLEAMSFARNYHIWIMDIFKPYLSGIVAEIGAGSGNFSKLLLECLPEIQLVAFEPSMNMYQKLKVVAEKEPRLKICNSFFGTRIHEFRKSFDSVLYVNVLEHIENDREELDLARSSLKPGGHICIFVPALPFLYSELDASIGHFRRYTRRQLVELVKSTGLKVNCVRYMDIAGIFPWYLVFVLMKRKMTGNKVSLYDRIAVPPMRVIEAMIPMPVGKNLILVAEKQD